MRLFLNNHGIILCMNEYRTYTHADPHRLKRWTHQQRFHDALQLIQQSAAHTVLDYGCGDGYLLHELHRHQPELFISGYDPLITMAQQARELLSNTNIVVAERLADLPRPTFELVLCLETCEHLVAEALQHTFVEIRQLVAPNGSAIFSVPMERGLISLIKNLFRLRKRRGYENLNWSTIFSAVIGRHIRRPINMNLGFPYYFSHVGFDEREFEQQLRQHYVVERIRHSPWSWAPRWLNPTLYYICRPLS